MQLLVCFQSFIEKLFASSLQYLYFSSHVHYSVWCFVFMNCCVTLHGIKTQLTADN